MKKVLIINDGNSNKNTEILNEILSKKFDVKYINLDCEEYHEMFFGYKEQDSSTTKKLDKFDFIIFDYAVHNNTLSSSLKNFLDFLDYKIIKEFRKAPKVLFLSNSYWRNKTANKHFVDIAEVFKFKVINYRNIASTVYENDEELHYKFRRKVIKKLIKKI